MSGFLHRFTDWLNRKERARDEARTEEDALQDELKALLNEARYHEEPSFQSDTQRRRDDLERETRLLFYEVREPQRSMTQGRCQKYLEEIERPAAVEARIGEVKERLAELRAVTAEPATEDTGEGDASLRAG